LLKTAIIGNNISYLQFQKKLRPFQVFSIKDAQKAFSSFDSKRLVEWQKKGYIKKIINKWYIFSDIQLHDELFYRISNCIYQPSYVSLESALSYYQLIPEAVYNHQAVSTRKTITYNTHFGTYNYRTIQPDIYFGYTILRFNELPILMAEPEKALLDLLYLNARLSSWEDIVALRLNVSELRTLIKEEKLMLYADVYKSKVLDKRIKLINKLILDAHTA
jgi:predicted transcriptional regulator of viral defense system